MEAYAVVGKVDPQFASHDWAKTNVKENAYENDFSTVWTDPSADFYLEDYDDAVYFYGGRTAIYDALEKYQSARIRNFANRHRDDPIHAFKAVFAVKESLPDILSKHKYIIMLAVADAQRDRALAQYLDLTLQLNSPGIVRVDTFANWVNGL